MEHRAFTFNFKAFTAELCPLLEKVLADGQVASLVGFIVENRRALKDPYEGKPIGQEWEALLDNRDVHEYGDFALTKYYDPVADIGLGDEWEAAQAISLERLGTDLAVLGRTVGSADNLFDPGRVGSYFQSEEDVATHLGQIEALLVGGEDSPVIERLRGMLATATKLGTGLYITF